MKFCSFETSDPLPVNETFLFELFCCLSSLSSAFLINSPKEVLVLLNLVCFFCNFACSARISFLAASFVCLCLYFVSSVYDAIVNAVAIPNFVSASDFENFGLSFRFSRLFLIFVSFSISIALSKTSGLSRSLTSTFGSILRALYKVKSVIFLNTGNPKSQIACVPNSSKNLSLPSSLSPTMYEPVVSPKLFATSFTANGTSELLFPSVEYILLALYMLALFFVLAFTLLNRCIKILSTPRNL